jgi:CheY-like chemotaxis protein
MAEHPLSENGDHKNGPIILAVDDSPDILMILQRALSRRGYQVETAENGLEALEKLQQITPKLILLDMRMPLMDGWQFVREFRNRYGRSIPIAVMTAAEDSKLRANEVGADSYIGKPFDLSRLYEVVEDTLLD